MRKFFDRWLRPDLREQIKKERTEATVLLARRVAHDIQSPALAIELMLPRLGAMDDSTRRILEGSIKEIKHLVSKLRSAPESILEDAKRVPLAAVLEDLVGQKRVEYGAVPEIRFTFTNEPGTSDALTHVAVPQLRSALSNVINNAVEAYGPEGGVVEVRLAFAGEIPEVRVTDHGSGIPRAVLRELGVRQLSLKGASRGLGLLNAARAAETWNGKLRFDSELGRGTTVTLTLA